MSHFNSMGRAVHETTKKFFLRQVGASKPLYVVAICSRVGICCRVYFETPKITRSCGVYSRINKVAASIIIIITVYYVLFWIKNVSKQDLIG